MKVLDALDANTWRNLEVWLPNSETPCQCVNLGISLHLVVVVQQMQEMDQLAELSDE